MTALTFALRAAPPAPIDLSPLTPDRLAGLGTQVVRRMRIDCGGDSVEVGELFRVSGRDALHLRVEGCGARMVLVGAGMQAGILEVDGSVGDLAGRAMQGGTLRISGNAGDGLGTALAGGLIAVGRRAGSDVGAALPGAAVGMTAGTIVIGGDAGDRIGDRLRRGTIVVRGDAGAAVGARMCAGTILVLGTTGLDAGLGMKRGTLILARSPAAGVAPTFRSSGVLELPFLGLLYRHLAVHAGGLAAVRGLASTAEVLCGDLGCGGKGEILLLAQPGLGTRSRSR